MFIVSQNESVVVNTDNIIGYVLEYSNSTHSCSQLACYSVAGEDDHYILGKFQNEEEARAALKAVCCRIAHFETDMKNDSIYTDYFYHVKQSYEIYTEEYQQ